jgi:putative toxin-antitoxin system antitoxin component (TIGR02293 family)
MEDQMNTGRQRPVNSPEATVGDYRIHAQALLFAERREKPEPSIQALIQKISDGIRVKRVEIFRQRYNVPDERLAAFMHISLSTFKRRRQRGRLEPVESDRFVRLVGLYAMAEAVFGEAGLAARWMVEPNRSLAGAAPEAYAMTDAGAREVEDLLGRIAHGIAA